MTTVMDRTSHVLDRPAPGRPDAGPDGRPATDPRPVPRGWGSHEERRMVLLALAVFVLLGLYAAGVVLLGHTLSV